MSNKKHDKYIDDVLIRLKREYSKDEYVSALQKQISELKIELGKSQSYIDELEDEKHQRSLKNGGQMWFEKYDEVKKKLTKLETQLKNDTKYSSLLKENKYLQIELKKLKKDLK